MKKKKVYISKLSPKKIHRIKTVCKNIYDYPISDLTLTKNKIDIRGNRLFA